MKVDVTTVGFQKKLAFTVPADKVRTEMDNAFRQLARQVNLHGFRKGKAPRTVLEARFGDRVKADVANTLIQDSYRSAVTDHAIEAVGQPNLDFGGEIDARSDLTFTITVDVRPELALETYTGVKVAYPKVEVAEEEVDGAVRARLEGQARLVEVQDRAAQAGDLVLVELLAKDGDEVVVHEQGTMIRTESDPYFPGVEPLLVGLSVGGEKTDTVSFSNTARTDETKGRTLTVTVKVQQVHTNEVPALTDELATELGYEGGAEGMRGALRAQMQQSRDELARNQARANLLEKLIEVNPFEVPAGMVDQSLQMLVDELKMQQAYRTGRDPRTISFSDATLADLRNRARFAAKAGLILEFVSKREKIAVTDEDMEAKYRELADLRGQSVEAVKGYFVKDDAVGELTDRLLEEKTLDWLLERAELEETAPNTAPATGLAKVAEQIVEDAVAKRSKKKAAPASEATAEAAPASEAAAEAAPAAEATDFKAVVDVPLAKLKDALETGAYDAHLDALEAAETASKNRKGALEAIAARRR